LENKKNNNTHNVIKNIETALVSAVADQMICAGIKANTNEDIIAACLSLKIKSTIKKIRIVVNEPNIIEVYMDTQLLMPKIAKTMALMNGQPKDLK
jgi:hypothetical protein